jgi:NADPH:quinone reductase-like Zn-dependent oxidoreductase
MAKDGRRKVTRVLGQLKHMPWWTPMRLMHENKGVSGVNMGHLWDEREMMAQAVDALLALYRRGAIKPHVDRSFSFEQAGDAHAYIEAGRNLGKVVLVP